MDRKMKRISAILLVFVLAAALVFAGCAKSSEPHEASIPGGHGAAADLNNKESFSGNVNPDSPEAENLPSAAFTGRKVIRNAELNVETLEFDAFVSTVLARTAELGGYVQSNDIRASGFRSGSLRYADMTLRIPAEKLDGFLNEVNGLGNVTWRTENADDVTDAYTDVEARLLSLRTEYDTLISLLEKAESLDDIIKLQDRLTGIRYEIESYEAKQRNYDNLTAMSTVHLNVSEVEEITPVTEESFGTEVSRRFKESFSSVTDSLRAFAVWLIGDSPSILCALLVLGLIALIVILCIRGSKKRRMKKHRSVIDKTAAKPEEKKEA